MMLSVVKFVQAVRHLTFDIAVFDADFIAICFYKRDHEVFLLVTPDLERELGTCLETVDNGSYFTFFVIDYFQSFKVGNEIIVFLELYGIISRNGNEPAAQEFCLVPVRDAFELQKNVSPVEPSGCA